MEGLLAAADREAVSDAHVAGCLHALAVDVNAPKADLLLCDGAGLEEPGGPEPLVDAHSVQISLPNEKKGPPAATIEPLSKQCSLRNYSSDLTSSTATAFSVSSM